ncbi:putative porin [Planctobacterium marinum]|uniref:Porin n=1 Tax=Planctobacterium marinum TaxID=1631968 RepID=A0AA48HIH3_9ALTE|nr:hypothetical protein MACH26_30440 [Planctobacterium marinum]
MKFKVTMLSLLLASGASAQTVNTVVDVYSNDNNDFEDIGISAIHYFQGRQTRGPLDQFSLINSNSFISAGYVKSNFVKNTAVGGQWHSDTGVFLGAGYSRFDSRSDLSGDIDREIYSGTLGYQASERWSVSATVMDAEGADNVVMFDANYEHDLGNNDYLGFSYRTNDDTDFHNLGMSYFSTLENGQYLILNANYSDYDGGEESWDVGAEWYFNEGTSVFANIGDEDAWQLGAQHYFTQNWAIAASVSDSDLAPDSTVALNLRAQF